ncbi:ATP-binding protein [Pelorhabdus rhamnosifermentans]|uniref:ATP-binding protein n=1 Tax=Pelorhabdus rhamnosifermentans TaxID=2772457 RepID=UPI001C05F99B|nr:ATP-binding protein [Pelorhabdus rhamnosifermentans]
MKSLLEPAVRLMNRLKYAYKFGIIGLLIVFQATVLISLLVAELNKNIGFATRERLGIEYIQSAVVLLDEAQEYRSMHYAFVLGDHSLQGALQEKMAHVDAAFAAIEEVDRHVADQLDTTWKMQMVRQDWAMRKQEAYQADPSRAQVEFDLDSRWIGEITDLMQHAGNSSNLAMDADFDTAYLIDSVLRKLPGLMDTLGMVQGRAIQLSDDHSLSIESRNYLLGLAGRVRSSLEQADRNHQLVFRHNDSIRLKLMEVYRPLTDSVPIFIWNFEQKTVGQQGLPIPQQLIETSGRQAIQNAKQLYGQELLAIDEQLVKRIEQYSQYRNGIVIFTGSILFIMCYLFMAFDRSVRKGVYQLNDLMAAAGHGQLAVRGDIYSSDEMGSLTYSINHMLDSLEKMVEEVRLSHDRLELWNQELEQKVVERTASLQNLLDHAGQGFLTFGEDLKVAGEYSAECTRIFNRPIGNENVSSLIYPGDREEQVFLEAVFQKIFQEQNEYLQKTYCSLLPEEIVLNNCYIAVVYKMIDKLSKQKPRKMMLILTDQTLQKSMEEHAQGERDILTMIVYVVTHSVDFFNAMRQYTSFCQEGLSDLLVEKKSASEILNTLFRIIHTFKGTFGQLHMGHIMANLHEMESELEFIRSQGMLGLEYEQLADKIKPFTPETMLGWLEDDITVLKEKLGENFFLQENRLVVENARLLEIEDKVQHMLSVNECRLLLPDLRRLRYKPLKELLGFYPEYVCNLAERHEKAVQPFEVKGDDILVDPQRYYDFVQSLGHVFRNAIVHGLESFDERLEHGKQEMGTITCSVVEEAAGFAVIITDDGRGMDVTRIREVAVEKGICQQAATQKMEDEEIVPLIFADGFSGARQVNELAGRGVGLSAVRAELEKLGGSVRVNTLLGQGTQFRFFLPGIGWDENEFSMKQFGQALRTVTEELLTSHYHLTVNRCIYHEGVLGGKLKLRKITSFIDVKGAPSGRLVLSADEDIVHYLATQSMEHEGVKLSDNKSPENILAKYANELFQSTVKQFPHWADTLKLETLVTILAEDASAKYSRSQMSTWVFELDLGRMTLSVID